MMRRILYLIPIILLHIQYGHAQVNLNLGLQGHWSFNGNANDISGNNNNGIVNGATPCAGKNGVPNTAYYFDGINDYIQVANNATLNFPNNTFTYFALIKVQGFYTGPCHGNIVIDKGNSDYIAGSYSLRFSDGYSLNFQNCNSPVTPTQQNYYAQFNTISFANGAYLPYIDTAVWDCIIMTGDGSNIKLYVNGQLKQNLPITNPLGVNNHDMFFGRKNSVQYPYWFHGIMDEIRIYNRALNLQEIDSLCTACNLSLNAPAVSPICAGQSTSLSVSGATTYTWVPSTGLSNANIANPIANPSVTTTYTITGTNANGCSATTTVTLNVGATLNITTNPSNPSICDGQTIPLSCSGAATNYSWQPTGTLSNPSIANPIAFPTINTTYTVTASNAQGCSGSATILVTVWPLPNINVSPGVNSICIGDSVLLQLSGGLNYTWMPNQFIAMQGNNAAYVFPNQSLIYTITGYDMHNCSNTASAVVNVNSKLHIIITSVGLGICAGDSATLNAMGGINYTWEPAATVYPSTGNPVHAFPTQTTIYTVSGTDANGCTNTATYDVNVSNMLDFKVVKNRDIECGFNQAQLFASGADIYSWWPSTGLSSTNSPTPIVQIDETTTYYVTGKKGNCSLTDSITVYVYKNNESSVFVPNAFSPNGDGVNDCIRPIQQANFKRYYFTVYNRFGNKVFSTYDPSECWNGQYKYKDAEVGVYFYYLTGETNCGEIFKKGDIMLMR
ncbi:MAG: LamG-like jellyroll fold domain-containing protein [Chitinophagaceae bacterium]